LRHELSVRAQCGFTLVELVIVTVLLALLSLVGSSMLSDSFRVTQLLQSEQSGQDEARYVLERLARELREVKRLADGSVCVSAMDAAHLVFRRRSGSTSPVDAAFLDRDDCTAGTQQVAVTFSGTSLTLAYDGSTARLLTERLAASGGCANGAAFCLSYLAQDGSTPVTLANRASLVFVQIQLELLDTGSGQRLAQTLRLVLRN